MGIHIILMYKTVFYKLMSADIKHGIFTSKIITVANQEQWNSMLRLETMCQAQFLLERQGNGE